MRVFWTSKRAELRKFDTQLKIALCQNLGISLNQYLLQVSVMLKFEIENTIIIATNCNTYNALSR